MYNVHGLPSADLMKMSTFCSKKATPCHQQGKHRGRSWVGEGGGVVVLLSGSSSTLLLKAGVRLVSVTAGGEGGGGGAT